MDKTFSWSGIVKEAKRVRWPKKNDIASDTGEVLTFTVFFAVFFVICDLLVTFLMKFIGVGI